MLSITDVSQIYLGIQGENAAQTITIDVKPWLASYPNGNIAIWHKRNGDSVPSATGAVFDSEEGTISWTPSSTDTYAAGEGEAEIRLAESSVVKKSLKIKTCVSPAVTESGTPTGSGWQDYLDAIQRAAAVAIIKDGQIKFSIDDDGHLILSYTDEVPVVEEEEESSDE